LFDRVEVKLGDNAARLVVEAQGNAPDAPYIQSVEWRGQPWTRGWISHEELRKGGRLVFRMGATPNKGFASAAQDRPHPSVAARREGHAAGHDDDRRRAGLRAGRGACCRP
jgi:putative alpha-1,2-mannosidase